MPSLSDFERSICYAFSDRKLLIRALDHSSLRKDSGMFDRLEFLGDRILGFIIADYLYRNNPEKKEGVLSMKHSNLVCSKACCFVARSIRLYDFVNVSSHILSINESVLADTVESLICSIFLDSDIEAVSKVILFLWRNLLMDESSFVKNYKSELQEMSQGRGWGTPKYEVISKNGKDHDPEFEVEASVSKYVITCSGKSKKEAEIEAAGKLIQLIKDTPMEN